MMNYKSEYVIKAKDHHFFIGDRVHVETMDRGGRNGKISDITHSGVYLDVVEKKGAFFKFINILNIYEL